ncbi:MAG: hypothetical protein ACE14O_05580 [Candidatus Cloacimonadaceae bacterium]
MNTYDDDLNTIQDDMLGNSISIEPNHVNDGGYIYENGSIIGDYTPTITGGIGIHAYGLTQELDMAHTMDYLGFNYDNVHMPWDDASHIVGTPEIDKQYWEHQTTDFTCGVEAQRGIISEYTGNDVSEAQLTYDAVVNGWLTDKGMNPNDVGKLLELYGIPCHAHYNASIQDLISELSQGNKVIVGVNSSELWNGTSLGDFFNQSADHAIWVTGVDFSDPNHPQVIINDSGDPNGAGNHYDLDLFTNAWQDSGFNYVATDHAPASGSFDWGSQLASYFDNHASNSLPAGSSNDFGQQHEVDFAAYIDNLSETDIVRLLMYL